MVKDVMLNSASELELVDGDFQIAGSEEQETALILALNQGGLKSDPILGPNLVSLMRGAGGTGPAVSAVRLHLARDGKDYSAIKEQLQLRGDEG